MIRLALNISCPYCYLLLLASNAWSADAWLILNDVEIMFCHVYLLIEVLMGLRYHTFDGIIMLMHCTLTTSNLKLAYCTIDVCKHPLATCSIIKHSSNVLSGAHEIQPKLKAHKKTTTMYKLFANGTLPRCVSQNNVENVSLSY